jgi:predicted aspartyl protease/tetratricopeptide (TPR) repeat protein
MQADYNGATLRRAASARAPARNPMSRWRARPIHTPWQALLFSALLAVGLQWAPPAQAKCSVQALELPVRMEGSRAIATVGINGTKVPLIVDSGAFFSMLTEATAAQLKLSLDRLPSGMQIEGVAGRMEGARMTTVDHLQLLNGDLPGMEFVVGGNEEDGRSMGLLGRNILAATDVEYDLAHGAIRLVWPNDDCADSNMAYWAGTTPVSEISLLREHRQKIPAVRTVLELNGHKVTALFDTGATTIVSLAAAHQAGVKDADMTPEEDKVFGVGSGKVDAWTASFDRVELGGEAVLHNRLMVAAFDMSDLDMLIGIDFFLSHRLYISKKRSRMFFTYNGGPVFALNKGDRSMAPNAAASGPDTLTADERARRGSASLARGDVAAALADLDAACAMEPDNAHFHAARADVYLREEQGIKALAELDTVLRLDPGRVDSRRERAEVRFANNQEDLALEDLAVLDSTLPPQSQIRADMARLYGTLRRPAQVIAQWNLWIPAHPHDIARGRAYNARCWARTELAVDLDKAISDCDEAVDADPGNASYRDSRGWAWLRLGKLTKSLDDFDRSLALRPAYSWSLYGRGLVHLGLGESAASRADLAAARAADAHIDTQVGLARMPVAPDAPSTESAAKR